MLKGTECLLITRPRAALILFFFRCISFFLNVLVIFNTVLDTVFYFHSLEAVSSISDQLKKKGCNSQLTDSMHLEKIQWNLLLNRYVWHCKYLVLN